MLAEECALVEQFQRGPGSVWPLDWECTWAPAYRWDWAWVSDVAWA